MVLCLWPEMPIHMLCMRVYTVLLRFVTGSIGCAGTYGTRITLYRREALTFDAGQLQLSRISSFTDPG